MELQCIYVLLKPNQHVIIMSYFIILIVNINIIKI